MSKAVNRWHCCLYAGIVAFCLLSLTAAAWGASDSHEAAEPMKWDATDWYQVMNFAALVAILFILLRKPVSEAFKDRIKGIRDQLQSLEAKKREAEKQLAEYEESLLRFEKEAEKIVDEYIRQGQEAKERIIQEARDTAEKIGKQARRNIEHEFELAKLKLMDEVLEKAFIKAEEKIKDRITPDDQERLVDEYIQKVVAK